jgi:glycosyltransferase involved in cell wall biosynthesis
VSAPISVCIVCRNERDRMEPCLASAQWADEIVVLDLDSSDGSPELARRYGARVISREPVPIVEMVRNEVAAAATHDWILVLDPDERVSPGLAAYLREHVGSLDVDAFVIPRLNKDFGYAPSSPIHRYEPQLRLYRRSAVRWPEVPNKLPDVSEERRHRLPPVDDLVLEHDRSRNVPEVLERSVRYAPLQAQSMIDRGETFSARAMTQELGRRVYVQIVDGKAHRDGVPGILRAATLVGFHFWVWASFWQQSSGERTPEDDRYVRRLGTVAEYALRAAALARRPLLAARRLRG